MHVDIPWWLIGLIPAIAMILLAVRGIRASLRAALILFALELLIVVLLALIVVGAGGRHGLSLKPLSPAASPHGVQGLTTSTWAEVNGLGARAVNRLTGASTPWNDLASAYAGWMKWPVIAASVSSMFAVMINSSNGIVRILHTMGREGVLPKLFATVDDRRSTPVRAALVTGGFAIVSALGVGALSGGLGDPIAGSNVYGYLGFLLTLGVLPVYVLTNLAAARHFARSGRFKPLRHALLPLAGAALMVALLAGQIVGQSSAPYTWLPWLIVAWVGLLTVVALWLSRGRPHRLSHAEALLAA